MEPMGLGDRGGSTVVATFSSALRIQQRHPVLVVERRGKAIEQRLHIFRIEGPLCGGWLVCTDELAERIRGELRVNFTLTHWSKLAPTIRCDACLGDGRIRDRTGGGHHGTCPACQGSGMISPLLPVPA